MSMVEKTNVGGEILLVVGSTLHRVVDFSWC
jgi:hypothetical protein